MHIFVLLIFLMMNSSLFIVAVKVSPCAKWNKTGTTVAGDGTQGNSSNQLHFPNGIFIYKPTNKLYVADTNNYRIQQFSLNQSSMMGITVAVPGKTPRKIYVDDDNGPTIYVAVGRPSDRVEKWARNANLSVQVGGSCDSCAGVSVDKEKNIYMSNQKNNRVIQWSPHTMKVTSFTPFPDDDASHDEMIYSYIYEGVHINRINSYLYVADSWNAVIQKWVKGEEESIIVAGTFGKAASSAVSLSAPNDVWVDDETDTVYAVDSGNDRIQRWIKNAFEGETIVGGRSGRENDAFSFPKSMAFDNEGNLYVSDSQNHRVQMFALIDNSRCPWMNDSEPTSTSLSIKDTALTSLAVEEIASTSLPVKGTVSTNLSVKETTPTSHEISSYRNRSNWIKMLMIILSIIQWIIIRF